jgi:hypothetical protein
METLLRSSRDSIHQLMIHAILLILLQKWDPEKIDELIENLNTLRKAETNLSLL